MSQKIRSGSATGAADPVRRVQILEITKVRTPKAMAAAAAVNAVIEERNDETVTATCQQFLKEALVSGPQKRRDVRRMAQHQIQMPDGKIALVRYHAAQLEANAKALGVVTVDKGGDGLWWSLPERES